MNIIRFTAALLLISALCGCASSSTGTSNLKTEPTLRDKYVHAVNESNRSHAASVIWLYYPSDAEVERRMAKSNKASKD